MIISQKCVLIIIVRPRHKLWNHTRDHQIKLCIQKRIHTQNMSSQFHDVIKNQNHRDAAVTLRTLSFLSTQWGNVRMRLDMPPGQCSHASGYAPLQGGRVGQKVLRLADTSSKTSHAHDFERRHTMDKLTRVRLFQRNPRLIQNSFPHKLVLGHGTCANTFLKNCSTKCEHA